MTSNKISSNNAGWIGSFYFSICPATNTRPSLCISTSWICTFTCADLPCCHRYLKLARQTWPNILTQAGVSDTEVIIAAILHDTVEDTDTSLEEVEAEFGKTVRNIVDEVSDDKNKAKEERKRLQIVHSPHKSRQVADLISLILLTWSGLLYICHIMSCHAMTLWRCYDK